MLFAWPAIAQPTASYLRPQDVLSSSIEHFPSILEAIGKREQAEAEVTGATGAFDATLEQNLYARPTGFYEGRQTDTRLVKPLPFANSSIYGGYRMSQGNFPIYEDERVTNDDGEFFFGLKASLLRDRLIDSRRLNLSNRLIDRDIADIELFLVRLGVQHKALTRYWKWVAAGQIRDVYKELLAIALNRQEGLKKREKSGDIAKIALTEGEQQIINRRTQLNEARQLLEVRANELSLYLRNGDGDAYHPAPDQLPPDFPEVEAEINGPDALEALQYRPEFAKIERRLDQANNTRRAGENALLPKTDLVVTHSKDQGAKQGFGNTDRGTPETVVKLNISIPLQQRQARGDIRKAAAKMRQLSQKQRLLQDKLKIQLNNAFTNLENARRFVSLTAESILLTTRLQEAEQQLFRSGASNFFILNMREQMTAEAKIKHIKAQKQYRIALANLYALTINEDALGLKRPTFQQSTTQDAYSGALERWFQ